MDIETAKFIVIRTLKASDELSQLLLKPLEYSSEKLRQESDELTSRVTKALIEATDIISKDMIWAILEEYPEIEKEIDEIVKRFGRLP